MDLGIRGKTALITGAGQGIGLATARALAAEGAQVCLCDVNEATGRAAADEIRAAFGVPALFVAADISSEDEVKRLFQQTAQQLGPVDILVNNAAISPKTPFEQVSAEEFARVLSVDLQGAFLCCQQAFAQMKERGWGRIISLSSISGVMGSKNAGVHYAAAKGGIISLTKTLAKSMGPYQITVNCVAPGRVATALTRELAPEVIEGIRQQIPLGRLGQAEDIAGVIAFLSSRQAAYITGTCVDVMGGYVI